MKVGKERVVGYVIAEAASGIPQDPKVIGGTEDAPLTEAILQTADEQNRNGRKYLKQDLFPVTNCARIRELIGAKSMFGENGHPLDKSLVRQQTIDPNNLFCSYHKIWTEGDNVMAIVGAAPTRVGEEFNIGVKAGVKMAYSLRALGRVVSTPQGNLVKDIKPITWDRVVFPSHKGAYDQRIIVGESNIIEAPEVQIAVAEAATSDGYIIPVTNQTVIKHIQESSNNLKELIESFELMYKSIVLESYDKVRLTTVDGDIFVINLESMIQNDIMDFCSRLTK